MRALVAADSSQIDAILTDTYPIWGEGLSPSSYRSGNRGQTATKWGQSHLRRVALVEGGTVRMPLQETFWAEKFGMLTDRFGTPWMINCEKPM